MGLVIELRPKIYKTLFLIDHDLNSNDLNGIQVIQKLKLKNAILVTSRYESIKLIDDCKKIGVPILPKQILPYVIINDTIIRNLTKELPI